MLERKAGISADARQTIDDSGVGSPSPEAAARAGKHAAGERTVGQESAHNKHNRPPKGALKH